MLIALFDLAEGLVDSSLVPGLEHLNLPGVFLDSAVDENLEISESESVSVVRSFADKIGICLSGLCVIHCLLTPFVILLIPAIEVSNYHEVFHDVLLVILPLVALAAFIPGYRRHRNRVVFIWSIPGLISIAIGALVFHDNAWGQVAFSVTGSFLLVRAHLVNRALCACCATH